jgi:hypothetical protein
LRSLQTVGWPLEEEEYFNNTNDVTELCEVVGLSYPKFKVI